MIFKLKMQVNSIITIAVYNKLMVAWDGNKLITIKLGCHHLLDRPQIIHFLMSNNNDLQQLN